MDASFRLFDPDQFLVYLRARNLSKRALSDRYGISRSLLRRWENGGAISRRTAERLRNEVGIPTSALVPADFNRPFTGAQLLLEVTA